MKNFIRSLFISINRIVGIYFSHLYFFFPEANFTKIPYLGENKTNVASSRKKLNKFYKIRQNYIKFCKISREWSKLRKIR